MKNFAAFALCFLLFASSYGAAVFDLASEDAHELDEQDAVDARRAIRTIVREILSENPSAVPDEEKLDSLPERSKRQAPARCGDIIFSIACSASCASQRRGRGFCDNGECGCR